MMTNHPCSGATVIPMSKAELRSDSDGLTETERKRGASPTVDLFAKNLHNPSHMEWLPDGRLLVSEHTAGQVTEISEGGDVKDAAPFVEGLEGPASILPLEDGRILVSEPWAKRVSEISGGDAEPFVDDFDGRPYSLARKDGDIYLSVSYGGHKAKLLRLDQNGSRREVVARDFPVEPRTPGLTPLMDDWQANWDDYAIAGCGDSWVTAGDAGVFVTVSPTGHIVDADGASGERYMDLVDKDRIVAHGLGSMGGIKYNDEDGLIYGTEPENGSIFAIDPTEPENHRFTASLADGLIQPSCLRIGPDDDSLYVCGRGEGVIWRVSDY